MPKMLRVLMVEPHESPHELFITDQLDDLQETVGGLIEVIGNGDGTLLVCNDEAKLECVSKVISRRNYASQSSVAAK